MGGKPVEITWELFNSQYSALQTINLLDEDRLDCFAVDLARRCLSNCRVNGRHDLVLFIEAIEGYFRGNITYDELLAANQFALRNDNTPIDVFAWTDFDIICLQLDSMVKFLLDESPVVRLSEIMDSQGYLVDDWFGGISQGDRNLIELVDFVTWIGDPDYFTDLFRCKYNYGKKLENRFKTSDTIGLADYIKTSRDFLVTPILADALEDAGLEDDVLDVMRTQPEYWSDEAWAVHQLRLNQ